MQWMRAEDVDEAFCGLLGAKQIMIIALTEVSCGGSWHLFKVGAFNPSVVAMRLGNGSGAQLSHTDGGEPVSVYPVELCTG